MLTNAFKAALKVCLAWRAKARTSIVLKDINGTDRTIATGDSSVGGSSTGNAELFAFYGATPNISSYASYGDIVLGSGDTPAKRTDYNLVSRIMSESFWTRDTASNGLTSDGFPYTKHSMAVGVYASGTTITVREVGWLIKLCYVQSDSSYSYAAFLADRTILDTPVVLAPGESAVINYTLVNQFEV